jgi:hypothetical protein
VCGEVVRVNNVAGQCTEPYKIKREVGLELAVITVALAESRPPLCDGGTKDCGCFYSQAFLKISQEILSRLLHGCSTSVVF